MSSPVALAVLGLLGLTMGVPVENSVPYDPQDFYPSPVVLEGGEPSSAGGRIVGGAEAREGAAPHMVALLVGELVRSFVCGGALVSRDRVLTAAHCIDPMLSWIDGQLIASARGQVGSNSLSGGYSVVKFSGHDNHPAWDPWFIKNDVGLLRLAKALEWSETVQPIAISYEWVGGGQLISVTGWGRLSDDVIVVNPETGSHTTVWGALPDRLQELRARALSPAQCEARVREAAELLGPAPPVVPDIELCTLHKWGAGYGMCNGDSGSAVMLAGRAVGVVSWGRACALGWPDVHARLSGFRDWLPEVLARDHHDTQE